MQTAAIVLAMGIVWFLCLYLPDILNKMTAGKVKVAEANARAEEAKLEQKKLDARA